MTTERRLGQERLKAGLHVAADGDPKRVDLFRWVAWLAATRPRDLPITTTLAPVNTVNAYDAHKERARHRSAELSRSGRDIGELPEVVDPARREACRLNFRLFCETYFPDVFTLAWSDDHLRVIARIEDAVLRGGLFAMAMPRGSGKTTLCETACIWAAVYGHRLFIMLCGASEKAAVQSLDKIKSALTQNELLDQDFPEVCFPIRCLEGINQRANGQLYQGKPTHIRITNDEVMLPTIGGSAASSVIIRVAGLTGRVRGAKFSRPDGRDVRPDFALVDDPQTDKSAKSPSQCDTRERIISGAVLGLAGPDKKIAALATVTVVFPDDLADRLLDKKRSPQWRGERCKMMYSLPTELKLWDEYGDIYRAALEINNFSAANAFYIKHRSKMDKGAQPGWPAKFDEDEVSAIQHAMNIKIARGDETFFAEYQNEPLAKNNEQKSLLSIDMLLKRLNGYPRGVVPPSATALTMMVDVQDKALFWLIVAFDPQFGGDVIDYGTDPDQGRRYFTLRDIRKTLQLASKGATLQSAFFAGFERLAQVTLAQEYYKPDGTPMRIGQCLIDANYPESTDPVYEFCRQSVHGAVLLPSRGKYVGAGSTPMNDWKKAVGDRVGNNWRVSRAGGGKSGREMKFDTNYWKSHVARSLTVAKGDPGGIWFFGSKPDEHRLLAEHLCAEYAIRTSGRGREVDEWKQRPERPDNHWWDCLVGCAVAASSLGVRQYGAEAPPRRRIKLSEKFRSKR